MEGGPQWSFVLWFSHDLALPSVLLLRISICIPILRIYIICFVDRGAPYCHKFIDGGPSGGMLYPREKKKKKKHYYIQRNCAIGVVLLLLFSLTNLLLPSRRERDSARITRNVRDAPFRPTASSPSFHMQKSKRDGARWADDSWWKWELPRKGRPRIEGRS